MSKYLVTFIEEIEGRDTVTHGGVSFAPGKSVELDSNEVEISPWFEGNRSFTVEEIKNEATEDKNLDDNAAENRSDSGGSEGASQDDEKPTEVVKPVKRVRRKAATK